MYIYIPDILYYHISIYIYYVYTRTIFIAVCHFPPISVRHSTQVEAKLQRRGRKRHFSWIHGDNLKIVYPFGKLCI